MVEYTLVNAVLKKKASMLFFSQTKLWISEDYMDLLYPSCKIFKSEICTFLKILQKGYRILYVWQNHE